MGDSSNNYAEARIPRSKSGPLRAGLVGTGYIAEFHARAIRAVDGVDLVCVCDANLRSAQSFGRTWGIPATFDSLEAMLQTQQLDCVHLLVPPDHHYALTKAALQSGVHVLLEKPMCTSVAEADELLNLARLKGLYLGVSHNFLFAGAYQRLRDVVNSGTLGPINQIAFCHFFELPQIRFGPFDSWMLREPGNVILETGPHLISALLDLLGDPTDISAIADRKINLPNGKEILRRWRIRAIVGSAAASVDINFGPGFPQRTIFVRGLFGSAIVDFDANTCTVDQRTPLDIDLDRFQRSQRIARQLRSQAWRTLSDYVFAKLKLSKRGNPFQNSIADSVAAYYSAVQTAKPLDVRIDGSRGRDIIDCCTKIIESAHIPVAEAPEPRPRPEIIATPTVLVLGGAGFIGRELIHQLLASGFSVRAMMRSSLGALDDLRSDRLQIVRGDIRSESDLRAAISGIEFVYHLAHAPAKTWDEYEQNEVQASRLVGEICLQAKVKRLIYTGTIASYYTGATAGTITEKTPLDPHIRRRDYYSRAKANSEDILMDMYRTRQLPLVIFRPGIVIGVGGNPFHWGVGRFSDSVCQVWGDGNNKLPFVLVQDVAAALVLGIKVPGVEGRSYNLVDTPVLSARDYLKELQQRAGTQLHADYRPIWRFYFEDVAKWVVKMVVGHPDKIRIPAYFDWESRTQKAVFDCSRARAELGWAPASDRKRMLEEGIGNSLQSWLDATK